MGGGPFVPLQGVFFEILCPAPAGRPPLTRHGAAAGSPGDRFADRMRCYLRPGLTMSTRPVLPLTGGCSCGAIRYEITSFPLLLYSCNCTDCQTASGSAFALNMPVFAKDFHILKGAAKPWHHISPTGVAVISWFCGDCGGRISRDRAGREHIVNLRAGTIPRDAAAAIAAKTGDEIGRAHV